MDLSKLSDADLQAIAAGDMTKVSGAGLRMLAGKTAPSAPEAPPDPSAGGGTLSFGPFDTGIKTAEWVDRGLAGAGKAMADLGRGVGQMVGAVSRPDIEDARKLDAPLMATTAGQVGNILGNVGMMAPTALIPGANTVTGGATIGAMTGLIQPSTSTNETLFNVGLGGGAGGAVPLLVRGYQAAKAAAEPFHQAGRDRIVGRALNMAAGGDAGVEARLRSAASQVPGVMPTVGEAAQNPGIAALQRTATATDPTVLHAFEQRMLANNDARIEALKAIAGDRSAAASARAAATDALYAQANGKNIVITPELEALLARPVMRSATAEARNLAANEGRAFSLTQPTPPQPSTLLGPNGLPVSITPGAPGRMVGRDAHTIKMAMDDAIEGAGQTGMARNAKRAATGTQQEFLDQIEQQVPVYGQARDTYRQMSAPINQADVIDAILARTVDRNVRGNLTPAAYNRALSDRTAASALGRKQATLADTFTPDQMSTLNAINTDLRNLDYASNAGRGVGSDTVQKLAYSNLMEQAGIPNFLRNLGGGQVVGNLVARGADAAYGRANRELANQLAMVMLDPGDAARLLRSATPAQRNQLLQLMQRGAQVTALGAASRQPTNSLEQ
jgi:hypothetical protein